MVTKLHVLFLCSWYPSRIFATNGDFIQRHALAVSLRHHVSVIHIVSDARTKGIIEVELKRKANLTEHIAYIKPSRFFFIKWIRFWLAFKKIYKTIDPVDVVHVHRLFPMGIFALYLKRKFKIPFIISEHWTGYHSRFKNAISSFEKWISKKITKKASTVCPVSNHLADSMKSLGLQSNYKIVPNVVDTNNFYPKIHQNKKFTIAHISDLNDQHKNIKGMLKVANELARDIDFTWNFIGGKSDRFKAELASFQHKNSKINFIDHVPNQEIPNYLNASDVFVLFSNYENLPCVILESFACGIPVISTDVGGIKEFFPTKFGSLIPKNDTISLIHELKKVHKDNNFPRKEMHEYAKQHFSPNSICDSFTNQYFKAMKKQ